MGERKVLNKYIPHDFDPAKIPRPKRTQQQKVRSMLPMSVRCSTCGNFMYKGTKYNSRIEKDVATYLGTPIFRLYFKCTKCCAEFAIKTDPRNSDYIVETGATRNFEPWRGADDKDGEVVVGGGSTDAMTSLEKRTSDSKREMDRLDALEELKSMKSRHAAVSVDAMLLEAAAARRTSDGSKGKEKDLEQERKDEELVRSSFRGSRNFVRRIHDNEDDEDFEQLSIARETIMNNPKRAKVSGNSLGAKDGDKQKLKSSSVAISIVTKPIITSTTIKDQVKEEKKDEGSTGLQSLLENYDSDESD